MKIFQVTGKIQKTAMPARLGEIDGIVHSMPVMLSDEAKREYPIYNEGKVKKLIQDDDFLNFVFAELGQDESALIQVFNAFVLEDDNYCRKYKSG